MQQFIIAVLDWLLDRLQEDSTWRGVIQVLTSVGAVAITPDTAIQVIAAGTGIVGTINVLRKQK